MGRLRWSCLLLPYVSVLSLLGWLSVAIQGWIQARGRVTTTPVALGFIGLSLLLVISASVARNPAEAFLQLVHFLPFFFFFLGVGVILRKQSQALPTLVLDLFLGSLPISFLALVEWGIKLAQLHGGWPDYSEWVGLGAVLGSYQDRVALWFGHPNFLACYLAIIAGLGLGLAWQVAMQPMQYPTPWGVWRIQPPMVWAVLGMNLMALIGTGSRTGWGVLILEVFSLGLVWQRRFFGLILLAGCAAMLTVIWGLGNVAGRPEIREDPRFKVWPLGWRLIQERPLWGWGLGNFKEIYPPLAISPSYADLAHLHNYWLTLAVEAGLPFTVGFSVLIGWLVTQGFRKVDWGKDNPERGWQLGLGLGFLGTVAYGLLDVTYYQVIINALGWFLLAGVTVMADYPAPEQAYSPVSSV